MRNHKKQSFIEHWSHETVSVGCKCPFCRDPGGGGGRRHDLGASGRESRRSPCRPRAARRCPPPTCNAATRGGTKSCASLPGAGRLAGPTGGAVEVVILPIVGRVIAGSVGPHLQVLALLRLCPKGRQGKQGSLGRKPVPRNESGLNEDDQKLSEFRKPRNVSTNSDFWRPTMDSMSPPKTSERAHPIPKMSS